MSEAGTEEVIDLKEEDVQPTEIEVEAGEKGWKQEGEYEGPTGGYVSAKEFLQREPLFDKIKNQSKELKGLKKTIDAMVSQHKTQVDAQVTLRMDELKTAKTAAIEAGDVEQVNKIDAELDQHKVAAAAAPEIPDEVSEWVAENPWFNKDKEMNAWAIAHNKTYVANNADVSISDSLVATAEAVEKAFPEKFKPKPKTPASPVEGGSQPKDTKGKSNFSVSRLSEDQKTVYNQYVKVHKIMSHEDYFKGLEQIGELA